MPTDYSHAPSPWREVAEAAHAFMHDFESRGQGLWLALDAALKAAREAPRVSVDGVAREIFRVYDPTTDFDVEWKDPPQRWQVESIEQARAALRAAGFTVED